MGGGEMDESRRKIELMGEMMRRWNDGCSLCSARACIMACVAVFLVGTRHTFSCRGPLTRGRAYADGVSRFACLWYLHLLYVGWSMVYSASSAAALAISFACCIIIDMLL